MSLNCLYKCLSRRSFRHARFHFLWGKYPFCDTSPYGILNTIFWFPPVNFFGRKISRTACGFRRSRSSFGRGICPHLPRPYKALSMLCLTGNSPSAEHTTFRESIVCYTLQFSIRFCFHLRWIILMIIFHFNFLLILILGRKKVADKNITDLIG